jgi:hypothetical protein
MQRAGCAASRRCRCTARRAAQHGARVGARPTAQRAAGHARRPMRPRRAARSGQRVVHPTSPAPALLPQALPASLRCCWLGRLRRAGRRAAHERGAEAAAPAQLDDEGQAPVGRAVVADRVGEHAALQQGRELRARGRHTERLALWRMPARQAGAAVSCGGQYRLAGLPLRRQAEQVHVCRVDIAGDAKGARGAAATRPRQGAAKGRGSAEPRMASRAQQVQGEARAHCRRARRRGAPCGP